MRYVTLSSCHLMPYGTLAISSFTTKIEQHMPAILIFTGSAGPTSATAAAATALHAAGQGRKTLLFSLAPAANLSALLGSAMGAGPAKVAPQLDALAIDAPAE